MRREAAQRWHIPVALALALSGLASEPVWPQAAAAAETPVAARPRIALVLAGGGAVAVPTSAC